MPAPTPPPYPTCPRPTRAQMAARADVALDDPRIQGFAEAHDDGPLYVPATGFADRVPSLSPFACAACFAAAGKPVGVPLKWPPAPTVWPGATNPIGPNR